MNNFVDNSCLSKSRMDANVDETTSDREKVEEQGHSENILFSHRSVYVEAWLKL